MEELFQENLEILVEQCECGGNIQETSAEHLEGTLKEHLSNIQGTVVELNI